MSQSGSAGEAVVSRYTFCWGLYIQTRHSEMKRVVFTVKHQEFVVTRETIFSAMKEYDQHHRIRNNDSGRGYAVKHDEKFYPPKRLLSLALNIPRASFSGGAGKNAANQVFLNLDFEIVSLSRAQGDAFSSQKFDYNQAKIKAPIPTIESLIETVSPQWTTHPIVLVSKMGSIRVCMSLHTPMKT
jgi:hypothetical protein